MEDDASRPVWDDAAAEALVGGKVLVGLTRVEPEGDGHEQVFGTIEAVDRHGITVRLGGLRAGETFALPPDLSSFERAGPGEYRLRSTGETIVDPDWLCTWTIHPSGR